MNAAISVAVAGLCVFAGYAHAQEAACMSKCSEWISFYDGVTATGEATLTQIEGGTTGKMMVTLTGHELWNKSLVAHVHATPCDEAKGGGHWKKVADGPVDLTNEFWYMLPAAEMENGSRMTEEVNMDVIVPNKDDGAPSIVLHDADEGASRMMCCNFVACEAETPETMAATGTAATFITIGAAALALLA